MRKVLIAPDKFKGSLSAIEVCQAIASGLKQNKDKLEIIFHPMADGGDDSLTILAEHLALKKKSLQTTDPLGRPITTSYFTSTDAAFIEVASASGLVLLKTTERNPLLTSTFGTGQIILNALSKGYKNIYLFLGGSATNDAGMGIAQALGFQFMDDQNQSLAPVGKNLSKVVTINNQHLFDFNQINLTLFYDVVNPLFGKNGAAHIYAPQKGANPQEVEILDMGLRHFCKIIHKHTTKDISKIVGGGAAGGIGAGLAALCNAKMGKGFEIISELTGLEEKIHQADWVISGEGRLDQQSLQGKVVDGIAGLCQKHQKPLFLFVGKNELEVAELESLKIKGIFSVMSLAENVADAMLNGDEYLEALAKKFTW